MKKIRQWYGDLKLQSKFTVVLVLIVAVPALLTSVFFYKRMYSMVVSYTVKQSQDASAKTAPLIAKTLQSVLDSFSDITSQPFYKTLFHNPVNISMEYLADSKEALDFKEEVEQITDESLITGVRIYVDLPSNLSLFTKDATKDIFAPQTEALGTYWHGIFQGSTATELFCPTFYLGPNEKELYGDMAYIKSTTLYYRHKAVRAYVAVYYSGSVFKSILSENLTREGSVSYILNDRNNLVVSTNPSLSGIYWLNYDIIRDSVMSSNNFIERCILDTTVYAGFYRIEKSNWYMVTILPSQSLIKESNYLMLQLLMIYLGILILAFFLANRLSRSVTKRISSVISQMKTVRQGPPVPMDSPKYHDEVGDLIDTYNYMTRKMNQLIEKQAQAAEDLRIAEFNSLQAQINPHFLYNTMDMINWLAQQGRTSEVSNAVQNLSRFYKLTLSRKQNISTIVQEEEHVAIYIHLQNMRFHNSIDFVSDIPDELMEYQIPKLTLQPVIENAILHGILEKDTKSGTIVLTGWMEGDDIVLLISDDGVGIPPEKLPHIISGTGKSTSGGTNIAVYNTHRRLQLLYGMKYGLSYSSEYGKGTEVQIRIPAQKEYLSPYTYNAETYANRNSFPLITISDSSNTPAASPITSETLISYSQRITQNLYNIHDLHSLSNKLPENENLYILAHEVTGDFPMHTHEYFELNYLCSGSFVNVVDGEEITMNAGDMVFLNRDAVHMLRYRQPDTLLINLCLSSEIFSRTLRSFYEDENWISAFFRGESADERNYLFFSLRHSIRAQSILASIIQEYADSGFHQSFALESFFLQLFDCLAKTDDSDK